jgi:cell division GTPase FtsZ
MKILVIGLGQCGGRIADRFARLNKRARSKRGFDIISDCFAVNTDVADLSGLSTIKSDYKHRIPIGGQKTNGHGVGKISELGAEIAKQDSDKIINAVRASERFPETDAFLLIAAAAGGTGSGSIGVLSQYLKERYIGKPVYNAIVLPFQQEEATEARTIYNTAVCLKSVYLVADAIFLIDNDRYINKNSTMLNNLKTINARIVEPFYNLLCAGEERAPKYVGSKMLDAGDIIQTLVGWTVIGEGNSPIRRRIGLPFGTDHDFRGKMAETGKKAHAMDQAIGELSLTCSPKDSRRALYLVSAPHEEMSMDLIKEIGDHLRDVAPNALIRSGDYPRQKKSVDVTLILSEISAVRKITGYFTRAIDLISVVKARQQGLQYPDRKLEAIFDDIPILLE